MLTKIEHGKTVVCRVLLAVVLCPLGAFAQSNAVPDGAVYGAIKRSRAVIREFRAANPCPATGKTSGACPGWHVDHVQALVCGGTDTADNLQWLAVAEHREKTRAEVKLCRGPAKSKSVQPTEEKADGKPNTTTSTKTSATTTQPWDGRAKP